MSKLKLRRGVVAAAMITVTTLGIAATGAAYGDEPGPDGSSSQQNPDGSEENNGSSAVGANALVEFQVTFRNDSDVANFSACVFADSAAQCTNGGVNAGESAVVRGISEPGEQVQLSVSLNGVNAGSFDAQAEGGEDLTVVVTGDENELSLAVD